MPAAVAVIGVVAAVAGVGVAAYGMVQQQKAAKEQAKFQAQAIELQKKNEALRKKAMDLDATRRKREIARANIAARARAEAVGTNQGQIGSALPGAFGGIEGRSGVNALGVNQSQEIGAGVFENNASISDAYRGAALAGGKAATGAGLVSLGGMLINNYDTIGKVGSFFAPSSSPSFSPNTSAGAVY